MDDQQKASLSGLSAQLKRLMNNWPIDESRAKGLSREFRVVWDEIGDARFKAAVTNIITNSDLRFFPSVGEFRGYVPNTARIVYCGQCTEGWRYVPDYEARRLYNNDSAMAVIRCGCARVA